MIEGAVVVEEGKSGGDGKIGETSSGEPLTRDMKLSKRMFWREKSSWRTAGVMAGMLRRSSLLLSISVPIFASISIPPAFVSFVAKSGRMSSCLYMNLATLSRIGSIGFEFVIETSHGLPSSLEIRAESEFCC